MSKFAWIDYDDEQRRRMNALARLFSETDARDELGLGVIRDSISDLLFPGTSTIQTRIRYMLFIPWLFIELEGKELTGSDFEKAADRAERKLIKILTEQNPSEWGVFGRVTEDLIRLPSSVYWQGLKHWGIRVFQGSTADYCYSMVDCHKRRQIVRGEEEENFDSKRINWHKGVYSLKPESFPDKVTLDLTYEEALYIKERIQTTQNLSLLARFLEYPRQINDSIELWEYPVIEHCSQEQKGWVEHARLFSKIMHGAALLYNYYVADTLARDKSDKGKKWYIQYSDKFLVWVKSINDEEKTIKSWDIGAFWGMVDIKAMSNYPGARAFIETWGKKVKTTVDLKKLIDDVAIRTLIYEREGALKLPNSRRLSSAEARRRWNGEVGSGTRPYNFRWPIAKNFLNEIFKGLSR